MEQQLPGSLFASGDVEYYDPYELEPGQKVHAVMSKDFLFASQKEYRFFFMPRNARIASGYIDVRLGSLADIGELVRNA
jgi:hypothetical protein